MEPLTFPIFYLTWFLFGILRPLCTLFYCVLVTLTLGLASKDRWATLGGVRDVGKGSVHFFFLLRTAHAPCVIGTRRDFSCDLQRGLDFGQSAGFMTPDDGWRLPRASPVKGSYLARRSGWTRAFSLCCMALGFRSRVTGILFLAF